MVDEYLLTDQLWLVANSGGVGRIRRETWQLHIGNTTRDISELSVHDVHTRLEPMLAKLTPKITALECLWVYQTFASSWRLENDKLMEMLVKLCR